MRFIIMHKQNAVLEKGFAPDPEVMAGVGAMLQEAGRQGLFLDGEGLKPTSERIHASYKNGKRTLTNGPFANARELLAGFALLKVKSKEEAIVWLDKLAAVIGDVEITLGPMVEMWDFGAPKPADAPLRFLAVHSATAKSEKGESDEAAAAKMAAFVEEGKKAGVLQATASLAPTKKGARVLFENGKKKTVIDGPFAESKEMIAGYAIFELASKEAAFEWAIRFGEVVKVDEVEIRELSSLAFLVPRDERVAM